MSLNLGDDHFSSTPFSLLRGEITPHASRFVPWNVAPEVVLAGRCINLDFLGLAWID